MGCLIVTSEGGKTRGYINALYLAPEILGQGFGKKIANLMMEKARAMGADHITLESSITARKFYKSLGFEDNGPMVIQPIGGFGVRCFPMILKLS